MTISKLSDLHVLGKKSGIRTKKSMHVRTKDRYAGLHRDVGKSFMSLWRGCLSWWWGLVGTSWKNGMQGHSPKLWSRTFTGLGGDLGTGERGTGRGKMVELKWRGAKGPSPSFFTWAERLWNLQLQSQATDSQMISAHFQSVLAQSSVNKIQRWFQPAAFKEVVSLVNITSLSFWQNHHM